MLNIPTAALRLRRDLAAAEKASDELLLHLASIQATMVTARMDNELPMETGQAAIMRLQRATSQAITAQTDLFRVHETLANMGREMMGGDEAYCPPRAGLDDANTSAIDLAA
jgi:hypothetical protein